MGGASVLVCLYEACDRFIKIGRLPTGAWVDQLLDPVTEIDLELLDLNQPDANMVVESLKPGEQLVERFPRQHFISSELLGFVLEFRVDPQGARHHAVGQDHGRGGVLAGAGSIELQPNLAVVDQQQRGGHPGLTEESIDLGGQELGAFPLLRYPIFGSAKPEDDDGTNDSQPGRNVAPDGIHRFVPLYPDWSLLEFRVLCLRLRQNGHIGVGVLPQQQEFLIHGSSAHLITPARQRSGFLQESASAGRVSHHQSPVVEDLLKLRDRLLMLSAGGIGLTHGHTRDTGFRRRS